MLQKTRTMAAPRVIAIFSVGGLLMIVIIISQLFAFDSPELTAKLQALKASMPGQNIQKKLQQYEQLWKESVDARHKLYKEFNHPLKSLWPADFRENYAKYPFTVWDFFPPAFNCPHEMERVGRLGDGGKWICGMSRYETTSFRRPCVVYSLGTQADTSFEEALLRRTACQVFRVDTAEEKKLKSLTPDQKSRAHFHRFAIGAKTNQDAPVYTIQDIMKLNRHEYLDVLKMDSTFAEFEATASLMEVYKNEPLPIGQFQVQIRLEGKAVDFPHLLKWWERLEKAGLRAVWSEPKLTHVTVEEEGGPKMPKYAEYTFINVRHPRNVLLSE